MSNPLRAFWMRPHLIAAIAAAAAIALVLPGPPAGLPSLARLLVGWCVGVAVYAAFIVHRATGQSRDALRREAARLDDSAAVISVFALAAAGASLGAVAVLVSGGQDAGIGKAGALGLAGATMLCAWVFLQLVFTVHYAHVYYGQDDGAADDATEGRGGLDFHGDEAPDFWDFLYFTVTIGAAAATSDTNIQSKRMRRIATVQTVCAYLFNTGILAIAVNMAAGFVPH